MTPTRRSTARKASSFPGGLTFDDALLLPGFTDFRREEADLTTVLHPTITLQLPILSSPMDTVTEAPMAAALAQAGGLGVIHRNLKPKVQAGMVENVKMMRIADRTYAALDAKGRLLVAAAVGAGDDLPQRLKLLLEAETDVIVVDAGHGHAQYILDAVVFIKKQSRAQVVMAGNVATAEGAKALVKAGADILRVGVGPGSICTTRIVTGVGVPQVTAIMEAVRGVKEGTPRRRGSAGQGVTVIADGGIRQMGDMAKAIGCGAHAVMLGSMLAGHDEAPGECVMVEGKAFKQYRGMGSVAAMQKGGAERYGQSTMTPGKKLIAEGVEALVPAKGPVADFLYQSGGALRSAFYYVGARTLLEFHRNAQFIRITHAGLQESHPHTITITDVGGSYLS